MDEAAIVKAAPQKATEDTSKEHAHETLYREYSKLFDYFDVQPGKFDDDLSTIWNFAKESAANKDDKEEILMNVIRLRHKLGDAGLGERPFSKLKIYIQEMNRRNEIDRRLAEMEHGR